LITVSRRVCVGTLLAVGAAAQNVTPAFAQTPLTGRAADRAAAVKKAADLRTFRKFQEAIDVLTPYVNDNDFDVFIEIGRDIEGFTTPLDRLRAVEWYNKAIALKPNDKNGYIRRAGAYGSAGFRWFEARLADRQKVVQLSEAASPTKTAAAGEYSDLAGAMNSFVSLRFGIIDLNRAKEVLQVRSKAIDVEETYGRLLDRAELLNSPLNDGGAARSDVERADYVVKRYGSAVATGPSADPNSPSSIYARAESARRIAGLPTSVTLAGLSVTGLSTNLIRPTVPQLRNEALDYYTRYIDAFEASGHDYSKWGDGIGAYENRAAVYRSLGGTYHGKAIEDQTTLIGLNRRNPDYYRNRAISLDALGKGIEAMADYQTYLDLNATEDLGNVGQVRARLANGLFG
jgi:tetratricopeptide (TPR) repeat protein